MAEKKKDNYNKKEVKELIKILDEKEKKMVDAKMDFAKRKIKDVHLPRKYRKEIASIKTALRSKELEK